MSRRQHHNPKKVFWAIFSIALVLSVIVLILSSSSAPKADEVGTTTTDNPNATQANPVAVPFPASACSEKFDFMIVADGSGSMNNVASNGSYPGALMKKFVAQAISSGAFHSGTDQLGLIKFSDPTVVKIDFTSDFASVGSAVSGMTFQLGSSGITGGVTAASQEFQSDRRAGSPGIVLVLSDSSSTMNSNATTTANTDATQNNMRYFTVSFSGRNNNLVSLATAGEGSYTNVPDADSINAAVTSVFNQINSLVDGCTLTSLSVNPTTVSTGNLTQATFTITNHTRSAITNATVTQPLPDGLTSTNGVPSISATVSELDSGATSVQTANIMGGNGGTE